MQQFDAETARSLGLHASPYDFPIYHSIGVTVCVTMKAAGVPFVFASLIHNSSRKRT